MRSLALLAALALAACSEAGPDPKAEGPRQVAPVLTGADGARSPTASPGRKWRG